MTKQEFVDKFCNFNLVKGTIGTSLMDKYGLAYFIIKDVIEINKAETLLEKYGFTVERQIKDYQERNIMWSKVFKDGKEVAYVDLQGFPSIEFHKRKRKILINSQITDDTLVIEPIKGVHRILDWHTVKNKMHCLAGGQTVLYLLPTEITDELLQEWVIKLNLQPIVDKTKKQLTAK